MPGPVRPSRLHVLVLAEDGPMRRALARHFITSSLDVELVESFKEIESRTNGDHPPPELIVLLPSPRGAFGAGGVAALVVRACSLIPKPPSPPSDDGHRTTLASLVSTYALQRAFSPQQVKVLRLYLTGKNDKEIAELCACSPATIYEHWQRMARKGGAQHKADVIADFHRFLGNE